MDKILSSGFKSIVDANLLVGNDSKDDAAVYEFENGTTVVSTTDFFMPIVNDFFMPIVNDVFIHSKYLLS